MTKQNKKQMDYVIIEQDGDGGAYITWVDDLENYQSIGDGVFIWMKAEDYYNMCRRSEDLK